MYGTESGVGHFNPVMVQNLLRIPEPEEFENPDKLSKTKPKEATGKSAEKAPAKSATKTAKAPSLANSSQRGPSKLVLTN